MSFHSLTYTLFRFVVVLLITTCRSDPVVSNTYFEAGGNYTHSAYCFIDNADNWSLPDVHIRFNVTTINFACPNLDIKYSQDGSEICARFKSWISNFLSRIDFTVTTPFPTLGGSCNGIKDCQEIGSLETTELSATSSQQPSRASSVTSSADLAQGTTAVLSRTAEKVPQSMLNTLCFCPCQTMLLPSRLPTEDETQDLTSANMTVDKRSTSKWIRTKISAQDSRTSSLSIGCVAVLVLVVTAGCIVLPDIANLLRFMRKQYK